MSLILRPGISWCTCAQRSVFLDLARDRYFCLPDGLDALFRRWMAGAAPDAAEAQPLVAAGVLVPGCGSSAAATRHQAATLDLATGRSSHSMRDTLAAVSGQLHARARLKRRSLDMVVAGSVPPCPPLPRDEAVLRRIAGAFETSAMLLRAADQCLPRAIAASRLCRRRGQRAALIFGVRLHPFAAHSWVQSEDAVVVGDLEQVRLYTPILVVR